MYNNLGFSRPHPNIANLHIQRQIAVMRTNLVQNPEPVIFAQPINQQPMVSNVQSPQDILQNPIPDPNPQPDSILSPAKVEPALNANSPIEKIEAVEINPADEVPPDRVVAPTEIVPDLGVIERNYKSGLLSTEIVDVPYEEKLDTPEPVQTSGVEVATLEAPAAETTRDSMTQRFLALIRPK